MHISTTPNLYVSKSCYHHICNSLFTYRLVQILDFGEISPDRQVLSKATRKVLGNSKHTLLCLYGHNIMARINLIFVWPRILLTLCIGIPYSLGHALLATELCDCSVDCHSPHDWDNSISLLASIYIEDCLESASHNSYFFVWCKIKLLELHGKNKTYAEWGNMNHHR